MKNTTCIFLISLLVISFLFSCKKDTTKNSDCFPNASTYRQIINKPAAISQQPGGTFYIIEQGTIDVKLDPCNLPTDFQVDRQQVTISGNVKATVQGAPGPCCIEGFVITKITR